MKISFCTYRIGQDWNLEKLAKVAKTAGYDGVEPRTDGGHKHGLSVGFGSEPRTPDKEIKNALKLFRNAGVSFASIATGVRFSSADQNERDRSIEEAKEYIRLADQLGAKVIRLFGGRLPPTVRRVEAVNYISECLNEVGKFARDYDVSPLIEQHDHWTHTPDLCDIMEKVKEKKVGVLWNNSRIDDQSFKLLKNHLKHFHIHDIDPVLMETMRLLKSINYEGYFSLEGFGNQSNPEQFLKDQAVKLRSYIKQI
jgi:sugar phosphate isomerase/epimerase